MPSHFGLSAHLIYDISHHFNWLFVSFYFFFFFFSFLSFYFSSSSTSSFSLLLLFFSTSSFLLFLLLLFLLLQLLLFSSSSTSSFFFFFFFLFILLLLFFLLFPLCVDYCTVWWILPLERTEAAADFDSGIHRQATLSLPPFLTSSYPFLWDQFLGIQHSIWWQWRW